MQHHAMIWHECDCLCSSIPPACFMYVCTRDGHAQTLDTLRVTGAYAKKKKKIFSFNSFYWHFLVDFVCKGVRKTFQYDFKNRQIILTLVCKGSTSLIPFGHSWLNARSRATCVWIPYPFSKAYWNPIYSVSCTFNHTENGNYAFTLQWTIFQYNIIQKGCNWMLYLSLTCV